MTKESSIDLLAWGNRWIVIHTVYNHGLYYIYDNILSGGGHPTLCAEKLVYQVFLLVDITLAYVLVDVVAVTQGTACSRKK